MATSRERLKIFENIIARVGLDGDVLGEYSKAMSMLNGMQTYQELNPPITPDMGQVAPQSPNQLVTPPTEGNGTLNLPQ